jgi:hypothetical protein
LSPLLFAIVMENDFCYSERGSLIKFFVGSRTIDAVNISHLMQDRKVILTRLLPTRLLPTGLLKKELYRQACYWPYAAGIIWQRAILSGQ